MARGMRLSTGDFWSHTNCECVNTSILSAANIHKQLLVAESQRVCCDWSAYWVFLALWNKPILTAYFDLKSRSIKSRLTGTRQKVFSRPLLTHRLSGRGVSLSLWFPQRIGTLPALIGWGTAGELYTFSHALIKGASLRTHTCSPNAPDFGKGSSLIYRFAQPTTIAAGKWNNTLFTRRKHFESGTL